MVKEKKEITIEEYKILRKKEIEKYLNGINLSGLEIAERNLAYLINFKTDPDEAMIFIWKTQKEPEFKKQFRIITSKK